MIARRDMLGLLAAPALVAQARAQAAPAAPPAERDSLPSRGAPTGRVGGATRGEAGGVTLDLIAPPRGAGRTTQASPVLHYRLSAAVPRPVRITLVLPGQARPVADHVVAQSSTAGVNAVRLEPLNVRLAPGLTYVWSVAMPFDAARPSRDLVASALLEQQPPDLGLARAIAAASPAARPALLDEAGYFYDAVTAAVALPGQDGQRALAVLLRKAGLA